MSKLNIGDIERALTAGQEIVVRELERLNKKSRGGELTSFDFSVLSDLLKLGVMCSREQRSARMEEQIEELEQDRLKELATEATKYLLKDGTKT